jgi:hypothetical protein
MPPAHHDTAGLAATGVSFVNNNNGTATLSGTPTISGTFVFTITANNSVTAQRDAGASRSRSSRRRYHQRQQRDVHDRCRQFVLDHHHGTPTATSITSTGTLPAE